MSISIADFSRHIEITKQGNLNIIPKTSASVYSSNNDVGINYFSSGYSPTQEILILSVTAITSHTFTNAFQAADFIQSLINRNQIFQDAYLYFSGITVTGLTTSIFNGLSASTFSAGTIYSGSTNLNQLLSSSNQSSFEVRSGTNTYTGGTSNSPSINVSALTINTLTASGSSLFASGLSATTANTSFFKVNTLSGSSTNPERVIIYDEQPNSFSNVVYGISSALTYAQLNIRNIHGGNQASSDIVATANNGNESINYIDVGINSSNFSGYFGSSNDAYIYSTGNDLLFGNVTPGKSIKFITDGTGNTNVRLTINSGFTTISNLSATTLTANTIFSGTTNLVNLFPQDISANRIKGSTANRYHTSTNMGFAFSNQTVTNGRLVFCPFLVGEQITIDRIGVSLAVSSTTESNVIRLGIYNCDSNHIPSTLLLDAGTVTASATTNLITISISQQLNPGLYYLAMLADYTVSSAIRGIPTTAFQNPLGWTSNPTLGITGYYYNNVGYGALPSSAGSLTTSTLAIPAIFVRIA